MNFLENLKRRLIPNWREVATGSWSQLALYAMSLLGIAEMVIGAVSGTPLGQNIWFQTAAILIPAAGALLRLHVQPKLHPGAQ